MSTTGEQQSSSSGALVSTSSSTTVSQYTLSSSDNPGTVISSVLLNGENYNEWSEEMLNALQAKRKTGFIDGSITKPSNDDLNFENWKTVNSMIVGWIQASIEPKVKSTVMFISDANLLWDELRQRFSVSNNVRVHHIKAPLASCRQEVQAVIDYYVFPHGSLMSALVKERDDEKFHQFVMGLDDSRFGGICTSLINMDPLPSLGVAYSKVIREKQRLASSRHQEQRQKAVGFVTRRELVSPSIATENQPVNHVESTIVRSRPVLCSQCGHHNGVVRGSGGRGCGGRGAGRGRGQIATAYATSSNPSALPEFTLDQLRALSQLLQERTSTNSSGKPKFGDIILDTWASHHMTGNLTSLTNVGPISPCSDRFSRTLIGRGEERDGVYYLTDVATAKIHTVNVSSDQALWHQRFGHPSSSVLSVLPMVFVSGSSNSSLSCDFGMIVKTVCSDNGTAFMCLSSYFQQQGIVHQTSYVGTPQQNGRVERKHRHILNVARTLLFQASLPIKFWGEAVMIAAYLINRTPTPLHNNRSPYEVLHGTKPAYDQLRVFGSACYTHQLSRDKDKFGSQSRLCVFVGYPFGQKEVSSSPALSAPLVTDSDWCLPMVVPDRGSTGTPTPVACEDHNVSSVLPSSVPVAS
ncbi:PREDICTED: uncharacterized protein LOC109126372 [Camelina sativa]|uniref:Uncharacterized protein LOC109126372 n=1 Tax=Camelina sativa TaxID=90675 RepID=A0ABM1QF85_CAMSA|nr:PREDICTED: uncharacterized protein LOC109126372 [Camelina sativa]